MNSDDGGSGKEEMDGEEGEEMPPPFTVLQSVLSVLPFTAENKIAKVLQ